MLRLGWLHLCLSIVLALELLPLLVGAEGFQVGQHRFRVLHQSLAPHFPHQADVCCHQQGLVFCSVTPAEEFGGIPRFAPFACLEHGHHRGGGSVLLKGCQVGIKGLHHRVPPFRRKLGHLKPFVLLLRIRR
ncbi:MAG: hypothetical protein KDK99_08880 [Verrucomicrobiales bacterium]|nr:hypothetical protein [Verrucomicrobiales bacterium]